MTRIVVVSSFREENKNDEDDGRRQADKEKGKINKKKEEYESSVTLIYFAICVSTRQRWNKHENVNFSVWIFRSWIVMKIIKRCFFCVHLLLKTSYRLQELTLNSLKFIWHTFFYIFVRIICFVLTAKMLLRCRFNLYISKCLKLLLFCPSDGTLL